MFNKLYPVHLTIFSHLQRNFSSNSGAALLAIVLFWLCSADLQAMDKTELACPGLNLPDTIRITSYECNMDADVCIGIPMSTFGGYTITDNGLAYGGNMGACDFDTSFVYNTTEVVDGGTMGPYTLDNWTVNSVAFTTTVMNLSDLLDSMNVWDPSGAWSMNASQIAGGNASATYGDIFLTQNSSGTKDTLEVTMNLNPQGTLMSLDTGFHELIFDNAGLSCKDTVYVMINCINCPYIYDGASTINLDDCMDMAAVCLAIPLPDWNDYIVMINNAPYTGSTADCLYDSVYMYDYTGLGAGPYLLQALQVNGSFFTGVFNSMPHLVDSLRAWDTNSDWMIDVTTSVISGGNWTNTYNDLNIRLTDASVVNFPLDTLSISNSTTIELAAGNYDFEITNTVNGCEDLFSIEVTCTTTTPSCGVYSGATTFMVGDCSENATLCTEIPFADWSNYEVYLANGSLFNGTIGRCGPLDTLAFTYELETSLPQNPGTFDLDSWTVNAQSFAASGLQSYAELVDSMNSWNPAGSFTISTDLTISTPNLTQTYGDLVVSLGASSPTNVVVTAMTEGQNVSMPLDTGSHYLRFMNTVALCADTLELSVACTPVIPCPTIFSTDTESVVLNDCADMADVCINIAPADWLNYSAQVNGKPYTGITNGCEYESVARTFKLDFFNTASTKDSFLVNSWNVNGVVQAEGFKTAADLLALLMSWDPTANWTLDANGTTFRTTDLTSNYEPLPIRQLPDGREDVLYDLREEQEATATLLTFPQGDHTLIITEGATSCADTLDLSVTCIESSVFTATINVLETDSLCITNTDLPGNLDTIYNACDGQSGEYVNFEINPSTYCIAYSGIEEGLDTACIVICDDMSNCDTTYMYISVLDPVTNPIPVANVDTAVVSEGQVTIIDAMGNDVLNGAVDSIYIVEAPANGFAIMNVDSSITYTPNEGYCNSAMPDVFTYAVCNANGCDTAQILVRVLCNSVHAFTGFSPNNDGVNDYFKIEGLQNYTANRVTIFNRWGNQVFAIDNYDNTLEDKRWSGLFKDILLPNGTYFYTIEGDNQMVQSGYVQLMR